MNLTDGRALPLLDGRAQFAPLSHAQPGGFRQVRRREMQASPQALPLLQVRQQVRGSSAGSAGLVGLAGLAGSAGSGRCGSLRAGFSGACCAIASPAGVAASISTTNNTYLTLPVLIAMIAVHFPTAYARDNGWAVIVALMVVGAWVRYYFNLRHEGRTAWWIPATAALAVLVIAILIRPSTTAAPVASGSVSFARVQTIIATRCAECHSMRPTNAAFTSPPAGVVFDTPEEIAARKDAIEEQAVRLKAMPLGNLTHMTDAERSELAAWFSAGAPTK